MNSKSASHTSRRAARATQAKPEKASRLTFYDHREDYFHFNERTGKLHIVGKMVALSEWLEKEEGKDLSEILAGLIRREHKAPKAAKAAGQVIKKRVEPHNYIAPFPTWLESLGVVDVDPVEDLEAERERVLDINRRVWTAIAKYPMTDDTNENFVILQDVLDATKKELAKWLDELEFWYDLLPPKDALQYQPAKAGKAVSK